MKLRHALFEVDKSFERNKKYAEDESDIDDEFIVHWESEMKEKEIEKAKKKFARDNEKLAEEGKEQHDEEVLEQRLQAIEDDHKRLKKERGTRRATSKRSADKLEEAIEKLTEKIRTFKLQIVDRDEGKEVALGTSKINYLDPR
jgi:DNA topoisomerase I